MTEYLGSAVLELSTDLAPLEAGLAKGRAVTERETAAMQKTADARMAAMGKSAERTGAAMTRYLTVPLAGIGIAATHMAAEFDASMERVHTQSGETQKNVDKLSKQILGLAQSGRFAQGPTQIADALYRLEGAGIRGARALEAVKAASDLAAVGNANVEDTAKTLGQTYFSGIKGLGSFKDTVAELNATVGAGDLRLQQLVDALGTGITTSASQAGLSIHDVTAVLAVFGDQTNNVSGWAAQFATGLHFLTNATPKAEKTLESLGLSSKRLAEDMRKPNGLSVALHDLKAALDKLSPVARTQAIGDILPGGRGRVIAVLLNQLDRLDGKYKQIQGTAGAFGEAVTKTHEQAANKIDTAWSKVQADLIDVGHVVGPTLVQDFADLADGVDHVAHAFSALPDPLQHALVKLALFTALAGPALKIGGKLLTALSGATAAAEVSAGAAGTAAGVAYGRGLAAGVRSTYPVIEGSTTGALGVSKLGAVGAGAGATYGRGFGKGARPVFSTWGTTMGKVFAAGFLLMLPDLLQSIGQMLGLNPDSALGRELKRGYKDLIGGGLLFPESAGGGNTPGGSHLGQTIVGWKKDPQTGGWKPVYGSGPSVAGGGHGVMHPAGIGTALPAGLHGRAATIAAAAAKYGVDPNVLWGIYGAESSYGKTKSSFGLTGDYPGKGTSGNFTTDANRSAQILARLVKQYGSYNAALQHYSGGSYGLGHVQDLVGERPFGSTRSGSGGPAKNIGTGKVGKNAPAGLAWAESMIGHFQESSGNNTGPELDKLEKEFGLHAAQWCAMFATKALVKAGFPKGVMTAQVSQINAMAKSGAYGLSFTTSPKPGDLVTFGNDHVAVVQKVNAHKGTITAISGNSGSYHGGGKGDGVMQRTYALGAGRYIAVDAAGAGVGAGTFGKTPKVKIPAITQQAFLEHIQKQLDHFDLMVQAGLLSATKAAAKKRLLLATALAGGFLKGDTRLQVMALLNSLPQEKTPAQKTWTAEQKRRLAMAIIQANPGNVANLPAGVLKAAGDSATLNNPWVAGYLKNVDNQVGSGALTDDQGNRARLSLYKSALPFLVGQDLADAKTAIKSLTDAIDENTKSQDENTQAQLDQTNQLRQQGIGTAGFLGGLTGAGADAVRNILGQYGIQDLPGGASVSNIGNPQAGAGLARGDIGRLMGLVNSGKMTFADAWPLIQGDLGVIAQATQDTAANTEQTNQALIDLLRGENQNLAMRYAVSQAQYGALKGFPRFGGSFADGGTVPGPLGAARMIIAHGGEKITPVGGDGATVPKIDVHFANGMEWLARFVDVRVHDGTRRMARNAARGLPGRGGGS